MTAPSVAPFNPNPKWPDGYVQVLRDQGIEEGNIPYFLRWIRGFFAGNRGRQRRDLGRKEIESYLSQIVREPGMSLWRVEQARQALEWYYEQFRGIPLEPRQAAAMAVREETQPSIVRCVNTGGKARKSGASGDTDIASEKQPVGRPSLSQGRGKSRYGPASANSSSLGVGSRQTPRRQGAFWPELKKATVDVLRLEHYAIKTERSYLGWVKRYMAFHNWRKPSLMGEDEVRAFLTDLAVNGKVAASTQNQALNALVFLYRKVLKQDLGDLGKFVRARRPVRVPVVASKDEVRRVLAMMEGREQLMARLLYGAGLRLSECLRLRVQDVHFEQNMILVRSGKGNKDRRVPLPSGVKEQLNEHLRKRKQMYETDKRLGLHQVQIPDALAKKYPSAPGEWLWQFVFAGDDFSMDPRTGEKRRHHIHEIRL